MIRHRQPARQDAPHVGVEGARRGGKHRQLRFVIGAAQMAPALEALQPPQPAGAEFLHHHRPRPRPWLDAELYNRLRVKPGITGMWQVNGRSNTSFADYQRLDLYYVDNWSILVDVGILAKTLPVVLSSRGAM